jgi:hypothetical protein
LAKFAFLAFELLQAHALGGEASARALIARGLLDPFRQRLRRAADLGGDRGDGRPLRGVLVAILNFILAARSRTPSENVGALAWFVMAPVSQELEPPARL